MIIKRISASYVLWFNRKYGRCGHLFQERFKSETVDADSYFLTVLRYIHHNPVKAKIAGDISEYKWSSYCEYMDKSHIVDRGYVFEMFSNIAGDASKLFEKYSREKNADICLEIEEGKANISDERLKEIITQRFGIETIRIGFEIRERQDAILKEVKMIDGASIRQIARITGLSQKRVWKA